MTLVWFLSTIATVLHIARHTWTYVMSQRMVKDLKVRCKEVFMPEQLERLGLSLPEIMTLNFSVDEMKNAFSIKKLKNEGNVTAKQLKDDYQFSLKDMKEVFSVKELKDDGRFSFTELKDEGELSLQQLKDDAGFSSLEMKNEGVSVKDMKEVFSMKELKDNGKFTAEQLKDEGCSAADLKTAEFSVVECAPLGFPPADFAAAFPEVHKKVYDLCHQSKEKVDEVRSLLAAGADPDEHKVGE